MTPKLRVQGWRKHARNILAYESFNTRPPIDERRPITCNTLTENKKLASPIMAMNKINQ